MPTFHFHVEDSPDEQGSELSSIAEAKCEAARYAGRLLCDQASTFWEHAEINVRVTDGGGLTLFVISISGTDAPAIQIRPTISR